MRSTLVLSRPVHARTLWPLGQALIDLVFIAGLVDMPVVVRRQD